MKSLSAASGERRIATPEVGSREPNTSTLIVTPVVGFVTLTLSPGRYPTVLAKRPLGNTPSSATTALPSKDGLFVAKTDVMQSKHKVIRINRFIIKSPRLYEFIYFVCRCL